jgi:hypothetical protein
MKHRKKCLVVLFVLTILFMNISAHASVETSIEALVGEELASALRAGESPLAVQFRSPYPQLIPFNDELRRRVSGEQADMRLSVMVEILYLYRKPPNAGAAWTVEEKTRLFNELVAVSTLAGIQYFSTSRGEMRTLYETSHVIDSPSTRRPLPDPVFARPPQELSLYVSQRDLTFGDNVYRFGFFTSNGALILTQENITPLNAGIIRAVGRNNLRTTLAILDAGQYILVYSIAMAQAASVPGMRERVGNSFATRAQAIIQWFSGRADRALTALE